MFNNLAATILLTISGILGVGSLPNNSGDWAVSEGFVEKDGSFHLRATSENIIPKCKITPNAFVHFPFIVHGGHQVFVDGLLIAERGNIKDTLGQGYYVSLDIPCSRLTEGKIVEWRAVTFVKYFARINKYPGIESGAPWFAFSLKR
jgi:hypothetical protein